MKLPARPHEAPEFMNRINSIQLINQRISHDSFYGNQQICSAPWPVRGQAEPYVSFYRKYNDIVNIEYSVVMPVFNQEDIIVKNVKSILENIQGTHEIILILDNCVDSTERHLVHFFDRIFSTTTLVQVIIITQATPVFETTCDNIGFVIASGKYVLEIQADMEMTEFGFNTTLAKPFLLYGDVIGVSGRCTHTLPNRILAGVGKRAGQVEQPYSSSLNQNTFYMYGTCNRGPLLLDRCRLAEIGFLDEQNFYLDNSEHDLFARALYQKQWVCGYVPIEFNAPLCTGSTRKQVLEPIRHINSCVRSEKQERATGGFLGTISKYQSFEPQTRPL